MPIRMYNIKKRYLITTLLESLKHFAKTGRNVFDFDLQRFSICVILDARTKLPNIHVWYVQSTSIRQHVRNEYQHAIDLHLEEFLIDE